MSTIGLMPNPSTVPPSERFFESNFCSEVAFEWHPCRLTWFTPSTQEEADLAFDSYANFGGRFFFFQFKFPRTWRERRTVCAPKHHYLQARADHDQMIELRRLAADWPLQTVLYAMPGFLGTVPERVLPVTHFWDVMQIPQDFPAPTTSRGTPRLSREHYLNLCPICGAWTVRSEPLDFASHTAAALVDELAEGLRGGRQQNSVPVVDDVPDRRAFASMMQALGPNAAALLVSRPE